MNSFYVLYVIAFSTLSLFVVESTMFSGQEQQDIVDYINQIRRSVSPTAADMREIQWSDCYANIANTYLETCAGFQHNANRLTQAQSAGCNESAVTVGENLYMTSGSLENSTEPLRAWASESVDYSYAANTCSAVCGHYTQIIWSTTSLVGCAFLDLVNCMSTGTRVVCNYASGGNLIGFPPYTEGAACSGCTAPFLSCNNGLCSMAPPTTQPPTATTNPVTNPVTNATTNPTPPVVTTARSEPTQGATPASNANSLQILSSLVFGTIFAITFAF